jgi:hypothetical protein
VTAPLKPAALHVVGAVFRLTPESFGTWQSAAPTATDFVAETGPVGNVTVNVTLYVPAVL